MPIFVFNLRAALTTIAVFVCILLVYEAIEALVPTRFAFIYNRFESIYHRIDRLKVGSNPVIVALGPSDIALNFSPNFIGKQIQVSGQSVDIYNFGVVMAGPDLVRILAKHLRDELLAQHKQIEIAVIRFIPMMYTTEYIMTSHYLFPKFTYMLSDRQGVRDRLKNSFGLTIRQYFAAVLFGGLGQSFLQAKSRTYLTRGLYSDFKMHLISGVQTNGEELYDGVFEHLAQGDDHSGWSEATRGEMELDDEEAYYLKNLSEIESKSIYSAGFERHRINYGFLDLHFQPFYFQQLAETIDDLSQVAKKVVVLYSPDYIRPGYPKVSVDGQRRLEDQLAKLKQNKKIKFLDYTDRIQIEPKDYFDVAHLTPSGKEKFNRAMAADLLKDLGQ